MIKVRIFIMELKMNKLIVAVMAVFFVSQAVFADNVFDSMDKATEVKLAPAVKSSSASTTSTTNVNAVYHSTIKEQKFNSALVNLDDAQVELRQELAEATAKYNQAVAEKDKMVANCKSIKKEIKEINKKMKNVEKSKKMINKNLQTNTK